MKRLFALLMLCATQAFAQPVVKYVSGGTADGDTITITGTGFGTHPLRYSFLGGPNGVTDNDSLRNAMTHIDDLHAKGLQGWQTQNTGRSGNVCFSDTLFITRLRANAKVRANRKASIVTRMNQDGTDGPGTGSCYTNGWGFYPLNKAAGIQGTRHRPWWTPDTLTTRSWYVSWWEYEDILSFSTEFINRVDKLFGPGTGYPLNSNPKFDSYHAGSGSFWAKMGWGSLPTSPAGRTPMDFYSSCIDDCRSPPAGSCIDECDLATTCPQRGLSGLAFEGYLHCSNCASQTNCDVNTGGLTYSPHGKWTRHEVYVRANRDSSEGATTEFEGVFQWKFQSPGMAEMCMANYGPPGRHIVTHAWEWKAKSAINNECSEVSGPMATWNKFTMWRFLNYAQGTDDVIESLDDVYIQADTRSRVMVGNAALFANSTHEEILEPITWTTTQITAVVNRGALGANEPLHVYVVDGNDVASAGERLKAFTSNRIKHEVASAGERLKAFTVETVLPGSVAAGTPFWADFWVKGKTPWRAAAFKVYYDSTRVIPIRYDYTGANPPKGCMAEFDDATTRDAKCGTKLADADMWMLYDKAGNATTDSVLVGRIQFLPWASGAAEIKTSCSDRIKHELGAGGVNSACMPPFGSFNFANTGSVIFTDDAGSNYITPSSDSWTTVGDNITVTGTSDWCTGNWDGQPPKEGGYVTGSQCAPLAVIFTATDSIVRADLGDTLLVHMNVWCDSVKSITGFIQYNQSCNEDPALTANIPLTYNLETSGFDVLEVIPDYDAANHGPQLRRCSLGWPFQEHSIKLLWFRIYKNGGGPVSHAGPLLTVKFTSDDNCQEEFGFGFPCQLDNSTTGKPTYVGNDAQQNRCVFDYGNTPANKGGVYLYERPRYKWLNNKYMFVQNLTGVIWGQ